MGLGLPEPVQVIIKDTAQSMVRAEDTQTALLFEAQLEGMKRIAEVVDKNAPKEMETIISKVKKEEL